MLVFCVRAPLCCSWLPSSSCQYIQAPGVYRAVQDCGYQPGVPSQSLCLDLAVSEALFSLTAFHTFMLVHVVTAYYMLLAARVWC
jgi:hypothetical protein